MPYIPLTRPWLAAMTLCIATTLLGCGVSPAPSAPTAGTTPAPSVLVNTGPSVAVPSPSAPASPIPLASPSALASPQASAPGQPTTRITVAYTNLVMDHLPLWIAHDTGIFQAHGLDVDPQYIESTQGMAALLAGDVTVFEGGGSEALSSVANGASLDVFGNVLPVYPFVFAVTPGIQSADDLRGKAIGVAGPGGAQDVATRVELQKQGLNPDTDVTIVYTGSAANVVGAMENGGVQGALQNPLEMSDLEALGFHSLFGTASLNLPAPQNVLVAQQTYVSAHREVIQEYVDSIVEAIARAKQDKALAVQETEKYLNSTDTDKISAAYDYYAQWFPTYPLLETSQFADAVTQLSANNPGVAQVDLGTLLDNSFVQDAQARGVAGQ